MKSGTSQIVRNGKIIDVFEISNLVTKEELVALRDEMHQGDSEIRESINEKNNESTKFKVQTWISVVCAIIALVSLLWTIYQR
ncbi:hypothetical protein FGL75_05485 [Weissella hellenica]|nr:hypothetical protein FGL75_05485 [Weissella hellenica]